MMFHGCQQWVSFITLETKDLSAEVFTQVMWCSWKSIHLGKTTAFAHKFV